MMDMTTQIYRMPAMGETIPAAGFDLGYGGKGANQASAARKLGAEVIMVSKVGSDLFGPGVIENLERQGINAAHVTVAAGESSGVAPIFVNERGENGILVIKGANDHLSCEDIDAAAADLKACDCLLLQLELAEKTILYCLQQADNWGVPLVLNPAPHMPLAYKWLAMADYLVPNEHELAQILQQDLPDRSAVERGASTLQTHTGNVVIVTAGEQGAYLADGFTAQWIAPKKVKAVDTTGAGDAFIGSFAVFLSESGNVAQSVQKANYYAAMSTLKVGTQKSFLTGEEWNAVWPGADA